MARKKIPDAERSRYLYKLTTREGVVHYVEAFNPADAMRHVYQPDIHTMKATEASALWRTGVKIETAIPEPDPAQTELPIAQDDAGDAQGDDYTRTAPVDTTGEIAAQGPPEAVVEPEAAQAVAAQPRNRGMFGRKG